MKSKRNKNTLTNYIQLLAFSLHLTLEEVRGLRRSDTMRRPYCFRMPRFLCHYISLTSIIRTREKRKKRTFPNGSNSGFSNQLCT
jgi:hypothetical protein